MSSSPVIEFFTFKLKSGITEEQFNTYHKIFLDDFLRQQPGFTKSELWKSQEGLYALSNYWRSLNDAEAAGKNFENFEGGQQWYGVIEDSESLFSHFSIIRQD